MGRVVHGLRINCPCFCHRLEVCICTLLQTMWDTTEVKFEEKEQMHQLYSWWFRSSKQQFLAFLSRFAIDPRNRPLSHRSITNELTCRQRPQRIG